MEKKNKIVKDLVCGMNVDPTASSWSSTRAGEIYFFCSEHCRDKFQSNPGLFINKQEDVLLNLESKKQNAGSYICPMCPEVQQEKPGACPSCGMALEPDPKTLQTSHTKYVCPMHPEIVQDDPGSCPICGMALEPQTIARRI